MPEKLPTSLSKRLALPHATIWENIWFNKVVGSVIKENTSFIDTSVSLPELTGKRRSYSGSLTEKLYRVVTLHSIPGKVAKVI